MKLTDEQHAQEAVKAIKALGQMQANEKIAVLKTAAALVENSLHAEVQLAAITNAFRKD